MLCGGRCTQMGVRRSFEKPMVRWMRQPLQSHCFHTHGQRGGGALGCREVVLDSLWRRCESPVGALLERYGLP